jgi:membrane-associated phospholipid phosphatase
MSDRSPDPTPRRAARGAHWWRRTLIGASFLALAAVAAVASNVAIVAWFPERPKPLDLLFEALPFVDAAQYVTDVALFAALAILVWYAVAVRPDRLPEGLALFGVMQTLRAVIMTLTPLDSAYLRGATFGVLPLVQYGMFPSGHAASVLLCMLLVDRRDAPRARNVLAVLVVVESVALILSHAHYTIDVVGGLLLSYFVWHEYDHGPLLRWLKRLVAAP